MWEQAENIQGKTLDETDKSKYSLACIHWYVISIKLNTYKVTSIIVFLCFVFLRASPLMFMKFNNTGTKSDPYSIPMACEVSTTGTRDTGVSRQKSWSVRSVVDTEVKPFSNSCWSPVKLLQLSWVCSFSSFSLFSGLSSDMWPSSLFKSFKDIWYSNSKSDSISDTATQKMVASRLLGWLMLVVSVMWSVVLSLDEDELRVLANKTCCSQAWIRSSVALRGGSDHLSVSPNFLGTEELLWCRLLSSFLLSCPVLFLLDSSLKLVRKSGDEALQLNKTTH